MDWLRLFGRPVCASCAGPVDQGRCPTCRRARMEGYGPPPVAVAVLAVVVTVVLLLLALLAEAARAAAAVVVLPA